MRFVRMCIGISYVCILVLFFMSSPVAAIQEHDLNRLHVPFYDPDASTCSTSTTQSTDAGDPSSNTYSTGEQIWTDDELQKVEQNKSVYVQAGEEVGIPWQMLAVLHRQEHGLAKDNPGNGQGAYQLYSYTNGGSNSNAFRPAGPISDEEFLRQTVIAANIFREISGGNHPENQPLDYNNPNPNAVKDTFFGYNGRADVYRQQAASLGFDPASQGFEGSPYVMNKADERRNPATAAPGTWGQVKRDRGPIEYPANDFWGAWILYASLAGVSPGSGDCGGSSGSGAVNAEGYSFPVSPQKKSENGGVPGMSQLPCGSTSGCHHDGTPAYDMSRKPGGDAIVGTPVYAISDGTIDYTRDNYQGQPGCFTLQLHSSKDNFYYFYAHISNLTVQDGQTVTSGQQLAEIGQRRCTGNGSDSHLHIDRGCIRDGEPQRGGRDACRDPGIIDLINQLYEELPE